MVGLGKLITRNLASQSVDNVIEPIEFLKLQSKLEFAEQLLQGIASATQELLTRKDFQESINCALSILGQATVVDRVYIFKQHIDRQKTPRVSQCWEWVTQGVKSEIDNPDLQNLPFQKLFPRWYSNINKGQPIAGWVKNFPQSEKDILDPQNILSLVVVPIHVNQKVWGFMGFDDCHRGHDWSSSEIAVLKTVANAFGGAFARHKIEQQLLEANQDLLSKQFKLTQEKARADRAYQAKQVFLGNISHELKTPLNGILGYCQSLQQASNLASDHQVGIERIHQSANHLNLLVNNLLDVTELESKELPLAIEKVSLIGLLEDISAIASVRSEAKNLTFNIETSSVIPHYVWIDGTRVKQVLLNLINNAIKFTPKGDIKLKVLKMPSAHDESEQTHEALYQETFRFIVEDSGIGITEKEQKQLFSLFSKVSNRQNQAEGAGLGLYISQKIIKALGSEIQLNSIYAKGSEFFFDLVLKCSGTISGQISPVNFKRLPSNDAKTAQTNEKPHPSDLKILLQLTQIGQVKKVITILETLRIDAPGTETFCVHLISLAKHFRVEEMETFLSSTLKECQTLSQNKEPE